MDIIHQLCQPSGKVQLLFHVEEIPALYLAVPPPEDPLLVLVGIQGAPQLLVEPGKVQEELPEIVGGLALKLGYHLLLVPGVQKADLQHRDLRPQLPDAGGKLFDAFQQAGIPPAALSGAFAPLSEAISTFSRDKLKIKGNIYLGLSPTSSLGSGTVVVVTMMVAPIITFLAGSIPGNRFVVQGDIVMLPYIIAIIVMVCRGDLVRSLLAGVLASCTILWCSTALAELFTLSAVTANAEMYEQMGTITNFCDGGNPLAWAAVKAGEIPRSRHESYVRLFQELKDLRAWNGRGAGKTV